MTDNLEELYNLIMFNMKPEDRRAVEKYVSAKLAQEINKARIEELEKVMKIPGNVYVGNGTHEIHWQTGNRIKQLQEKSKE